MEPGYSSFTGFRHGKVRRQNVAHYTRAQSSEGNDPGLGTTDQPQSGLDVPQPTRRIAEAREVSRTRLIGEGEEEVAHRLAAVLHVAPGLQ